MGRSAYPAASAPGLMRRGQQREQRRNAGGGENHELTAGSWTAARSLPPCEAERPVIRHGQPGTATASLPSVQPQGKQTALASRLPGPPSAAELGSGEETESAGAWAELRWGGNQSGPPSSPLIHLFEERLRATSSASWKRSEPHNGSPQFTIGETESKSGLKVRSYLLPSPFLVFPLSAVLVDE